MDLSLQVVMPELDARITTRPCGFRDHRQTTGPLATAIPCLQPDPRGLKWLAEHSRRWVELRQTPCPQRRIAMVLANYPVRDGRVANGVGLDTPDSTARMLHWLADTGHDLGSDALPGTGDGLMQLLLAGRTNAPEGQHRPALDHLPLIAYQTWWRTVPEPARRLIEARWGAPEAACDLDPNKGFAIHGLRFGHVVVLIQPDRGYCLLYTSPSPRDS